jgi:hypothetical protein
MQLTFYAECFYRPFFPQLGGFDSRHAESDVLDFYDDGNLRLLGLPDYAQLHHAARPLRGSRTPGKDLFMEGIYAS